MLDLIHVWKIPFIFLCSVVSQPGSVLQETGNRPFESLNYNFHKLINLFRKHPTSGLLLKPTKWSQTVINWKIGLGYLVLAIPFPWLKDHPWEVKDLYFRIQSPSEVIKRIDYPRHALQVVPWLCTQNRQGWAGFGDLLQHSAQLGVWRRTPEQEGWEDLLWKDYGRISTDVAKYQPYPAPNTIRFFLSLARCC